MESQDYEEPLKDLEGETPELEERVEQVEKDVDARRSEWEGKQADSTVPGAMEADNLKERYGAEGEEPPAGEVPSGDEDEDEDGDEDDSSGQSEDEDRENPDEDDEPDEEETESRGEGAVEEE